MIIKYLIYAIWIFLPSGLANATPPTIARFTNKWTYPLDFYKTFKGERILGDHKTIRGLVCGMLVGQLTFMVQSYIKVGEVIKSIPNYENLPWFFGLYLGFFALFGDSVKSFFKRRFKRPPGESWFPFDQIDWLVFSLIGYYIYFGEIEIYIVITTLVFGLIVHLLSRFIPYLLGMDKSPI